MSEAVDRQHRWNAMRTWLGEFGEGSWNDLRDAATFCALDPVRVVSTMSMLGHLEFSWALGRWSAPPPCLFGLQAPVGRLLITGAFTHDITDAVDAALDRAGLDAAVIGPFDEGGRGPSSWHVEAWPDIWDAVAEATGLPLICDGPSRIALHLPRADLNVIGASHLPDDRFPSAPIDAETLRPSWGRPVRLGEPAIQLLQGGRPIWWVLQPDGRASRLPSGEWASWLAARGSAAKRLTHDNDGTLRVDAAAPLPPLHARVACLCSGRLPGRAYSAPGVAEDRYRAVPTAVANAIITTLVSP